VINPVTSRAGVMSAREWVVSKLSAKIIGEQIVHLYREMTAAR
jgi:hypothetical protein